MLEEGNAVLNPINLTQWTYTSKQSNASPPGSLVRATATDLPGNTATLDVTL